MSEPKEPGWYWYRHPSNGKWRTANVSWASNGLLWFDTGFCNGWVDEDNGQWGPRIHPPGDCKEGGD